MRNVFQMQNSTSGVPKKCLAHFPDPNDWWKCIFAPYTYPLTETNLFMLNSFYDKWQMENIYGINVSDFRRCADKGPKDCSSVEIEMANAYRKSFLSDVQQSDTYLKAHNGVFLHSCWTHCASIADSVWDGLAIDGIKMRNAVADWYFERNSTSSVLLRSSPYNHIGCELHLTAPHTCNGDCDKAGSLGELMDSLLV